jgi:hypothetical protein
MQPHLVANLKLHITISSVIIFLRELMRLDEPLADFSEDVITSTKKGISSFGTCCPHLYGRIDGGGRPYTTSKGVAWRAVWKKVLSQYSAHDGQSTQALGRSPVTQRKYMAITLLTTSDCLSVCGWKAMRIRRVMLAILKRLCHTWPVNTGSQLVTIDVENP